MCIRIKEKVYIFYLWKKYTIGDDFLCMAMLKVFFSFIFVSVGSIFVYSLFTKINIKSYSTNQNVTATRLSNDEIIEKEDNINILEEASKCIVGISKIKNKGSSVLDSNATTSLGLGSGVIISENGYIVTNWHVAGEKYGTCYITLDNGSVYNGNVVWSDPDLDLAIIKMKAAGLKFLEIGDSEKLNLGQDVWAIGNPVGIEFQRTITKGIVSGVNRTIKIEDENGENYMEALIQTDASINSGNSGGALINKNGELIGINTVKISTAEGIGFAVPINIIKPIITKYMQEDKFEEAYLGIFAYDKEAIKYLNSSLELNSGIYVVQISSDGPARKSGLKIGDVITKIDDIEINKMSELRNYIYTKTPGEKVTITINRNNKEYKATITLGKK